MIKYVSNSDYKVRYTRNYLRHICEELMYGVRVGRDNIIYKEEGLIELKNYLSYVYKNKLDIPNEERTHLDLSLEWVIRVFIDFIEGKGTGDLVPPLSLAQVTLREHKDFENLSWNRMNDSETVYIKRRNGFLSSDNLKVKFKY